MTSKQKLTSWQKILTDSTILRIPFPKLSLFCLFFLASAWDLSPAGLLTSDGDGDGREMIQRHRWWHLPLAIDGWFFNRRHCYPPSMATFQQTTLLSSICHQAERYFCHQMRGLWVSPVATSTISFCLRVAPQSTIWILILVDFT